MKHREQKKTRMNIQVSIPDLFTMSIETQQRAMRKDVNVLELGNKNEIYYLKPSSILYVEADGNYCNIHLTDGDVLETVSFQRAQIARMIEGQLPKGNAQMFSLLGKTFLINNHYIMHINAQKQTLTFDINQPGTCKKISIKVTANALRNLRDMLDEPGNDDAYEYPARRNNNLQSRGFANHLDSSARKADKVKNYEIGDDDVMILGR